jgi:hypothetical protein
MLGHSNIAVTLDNYSRVLPNIQKDALEAMEVLVNPSNANSHGRNGRTGAEGAGS